MLANNGDRSPLLCNVCLHRLDRVWNTVKHGVLVRYCDDLVVMCQSREQTEAALAALTVLLGDLRLEPKAAKSRTVHLVQGGQGHRPHRTGLLPLLRPS